MMYRCGLCLELLTDSEEGLYPYWHGNSFDDAMHIFGCIPLGEMDIFSDGFILIKNCTLNEFKRMPTGLNKYYEAGKSGQMWFVFRAAKGTNT